MIPIRVDIGPNATLLDVAKGAAVDWLDVSCWVRRDSGISMRRGRSGQSEVAGAGSLSFTLDNRDGWWTPGRDMTTILDLLADDQWGSIPAVWKHRQLRDMPVRVTYGIPVGSTQPLWRGVITGVRVGWQNGILGQAAITATDLVAQLNRTPMRQLPVQSILAHDPVACWALDETEGEHAYPSGVTGPALALDTVGSGWAPSGFDWSVGASPGSVPHLAEKGAAAWTESGATWGYKLEAYDALDGLPRIVPYDPGVPGGVGTVHAMLMPGDPGRVMTAISLESPSGVRLEIGVTSTTQPFVRIGNDMMAGDPVPPGVWHHVAVTVVYDLLGTTVDLWVDGVKVATGTLSAGGTDLGAHRWRVGASAAQWVPQCWEGRVANVAAHDVILDDDVIADLAGGVDGWTSETTTVRATRVARAALREPDLPDPVDLGLSTMCASHTGGKTAGAVLGEIATTEDTGWWTTKMGLLRLGSRLARYGAPATLSVDASVVDAGLTFEADNDNRITDVEVSRPGWSHVARRSTQAADGLIYARDLAVWVDSDPQLEAAADWLIGPARTDPGARSETVTIDVERTAADINEAVVLGTDIDEVIEVTGLPANAPDTSLRLLIVGVADSVDTTGWRRTFNVTPAEPWREFWRLDQSELGTETIPAP